MPRPEDFGMGRLFWEIRDAVVVGDVESGRIVLWSPGAETVFGYSADEATKVSLEVLVPERLRARHRAGLARYRETGHGPIVDARHAVEVPALRKSGEEIAIELTLSRVTEPAVEGCFVLALIQDVTQRKRAEQEHRDRLREETVRAEEKLRAIADDESRQRAVFASLREPVVVTTCDGRVSGANPAGVTLFGGFAHIYGRNIRELLPFVSDPPGEPGHHMTWQGTVVDAAGQTRDVEVSGTRLGETHLAACDVYVAHDVSHHAELNRLREQLLHNVAHELRSPLMVVNNALDLLADWDTLTSADVDHLLGSARRANTRLQDLLETMLSAGSIQTGQLRVRPQRIELAGLIDEAVETALPTPASRRQWVDRRLADPVLYVQADPHYLRQVLVNLISNAAKYGPEGAAIQVWAERSVDTVRISVKDQGPGIPAEQQLRLFERFYRAPAGNEKPGVGLGLAIAKGIVESHGGHIGVESAPGAGTQVWFTLPAADGADHR